MARWLVLMCLVPAMVVADPLPDPTRPLAVELEPGAGQQKMGQRLPKLQAIVRGLGPTKAILDGQTYLQGEQVAGSGYKLLEIRADGVIMSRDEHRFFIPFYSSKVKIE